MCIFWSNQSWEIFIRKFIGLLLLVFISLSAFPAATAMDGVQGGQIEETVQIPLTPGAGDVVVQWEDTALGRHAVPHDTWGSSYATSKEIAWLRYVGTARAAGTNWAKHLHVITIENAQVFTVFFSLKVSTV